VKVKTSFYDIENDSIESNSIHTNLYRNPATQTIPTPDISDIKYSTLIYYHSFPILSCWADNRV
jgi:hypothetical protein